MDAQAAGVQIIKSISDAIRGVFKIQLNQDLTTEWKKASDVAQFVPDIAASLHMQSSQFSGLLALMFRQQEFLRVANALLGENYQEISSENEDAVAEVLNITYASARTKMNESGNDFKPAIPCLCKGPDIKVTHLATSPVILLCKSNFGEFRAEFSLKSIK